MGAALGSACTTAGQPAPAAGKPSPAAIVVEAPWLAMLEVGRATEAKGDVATAASLYERSHQSKPDEVEPLLALAEALRRLGADQASAEAYRRVLELRPGDPEAARGLGFRLLSLKNPVAALEQFRTAAARNPEDAKTQNGFGIAYDMIGDHVQAQRHYRAGLAAAPKDSALANNLGRSLSLSGDYAAAIAVLEPLARRPGSEAQQRENLALARSLAARAADPANGAAVPIALADGSPLAAAAPPDALPPAAAEVPPAANPPGRAAPQPLIPAADGKADHAGRVAATEVAPAADPASLQSASPAADERQARPEQIQLGAYRSERAAETAWLRLHRDNPDLFTGHEPVVQTVDLGSERGIFYRLKLDGFADAARARAFCGELRQRAIECMIR